MSSSQKTPYYNLSQFQDTDKPSWRGDYNGDMSKIDTAIHGVHNDIAIAATAAANAANAANAAQQTADAATTTADANKGLLAAMGADTTDKATLFKGVPNKVAQTETTLANMSEEIDGVKQDYVTKTAYTSGMAAKADSADVYTKSESDGRFVPLGSHMHIVLFGDSWTQVENKALQSSLEASDATVHNYGVSGAGMQDIAGQIDEYTADTSYDKSTVTHVAIVAGTNNVYFAGNSVTDEQLNALGAKILSTFGTLPVHYFPDNSCTINGGRNNAYKNIIQIMRLYTIVHADMFNIVMFGGGTWFKGADATGVQHLTAAGYGMLGRHMVQMMKGANFDNVLGDKAVGISAGSDSEVTFPSTTLTVCFNRFYTHVYGTISDVVVSGTNHNPKLVIDFAHGDTGSNLLPLRLFSDYTNIYCDDGNSIRGYFNGTSFMSGNNADIGGNGFHPTKITVDAILPHNDWLEKM